MFRESLSARAAVLEETVAETRAERGQLENYKQLAREQEAAKVCCMNLGFRACRLERLLPSAQNWQRSCPQAEAGAGKLCWAPRLTGAGPVNL